MSIDNHIISRIGENENTLVEKCIAGDRIGQNILYQLFASKMFAICLRYSKSTEEAEDTLSEGFVKVFQNIRSFRNEGSLEGWIRRIIVNTAIQKFKKQKTKFYNSVNIDDADDELSKHGLEDIISSIAVKELIELIQTLSPAYQMVFNLYVFEGLKHKEIAQQLNISENTSKSNLSDARKILQRKLSDIMKVKKTSSF